MRRNEVLDGIRGIAIALVLLQHLEPEILPWLPGVLKPAASSVCELGWTGVDVFFVLSGYLITTVLIASRQRNDFWSAFYTKRFFRIAPLFTCVCIPPVVFLVSQKFITWPQAILLASPLANWVLARFYPPYISHLWSLAVEEQFYFLWPFAVRSFDNRNVMRMATWVAFLSATAYVAGNALGTEPGALYKSTPTHLFGIALGSAIAAWRATGVTGMRVRHWKNILLFGGLTCLLCGLVWARMVYHQASLEWTNPSSAIFGIVGASLLTGAGIIGAIESGLPKVVRSFLMLPPLRWLGLRSYGIYLIHFLVEGSIVRRTEYIFPKLPLFVVLAVTFVLAEMSWRVLERPALALGARLTHRPEALLSQHAS